MSVKYTNNAATLLAANITDSATTITVNDASGFPTLGVGDHTYVNLLSLTDSEIVKVTDITGNVLTVTRAQDGTTASAFAAGDRCEQRVNKALLEDFYAELDPRTGVVFDNTAGRAVSDNPGTSFYMPNSGAGSSVLKGGAGDVFYTANSVAGPLGGLHIFANDAGALFAPNPFYVTIGPVTGNEGLRQFDENGDAKTRMLTTSTQTSISRGDGATFGLLQSIVFDDPSGDIWLSPAPGGMVATVGTIQSYQLNTISTASFGGNITIDTGTENYSTIIEDGSIELSRGDGAAYIDFKSDDTSPGDEDYDCRIAQYNDGLRFTVGGNGSTVIGMTIASSGDVFLPGAIDAATTSKIVGSGSSSLVMDSGTSTGGRLVSDNTNAVSLRSGLSGFANYVNVKGTTNSIDLGTNSAVAATIDSSQNTTFNGMVDVDDSLTVSSSTVAPIIYLNNSSYGGGDSYITKFNGGSLVFAADTTPSFYIGTTGNVYPAVDNTQSCGLISFRWSEVFAGTGTINTSAYKVKTNIRLAYESEIACAIELASKTVLYQFKDAVDKKGDNARIHIGFIADNNEIIDSVQSTFEKHGLDPFAYGILCFDEWEDEYEQVQVNKQKTQEVPKTRVTGSVVDGEWVEVEESYTEEVPVFEELPIVKNGEPLLDEDTGEQKIKQVPVMIMSDGSEVLGAEPEYEDELIREGGSLHSLRENELLNFISIGRTHQIEELQARLAKLEDTTNV